MSNPPISKLCLVLATLLQHVVVYSQIMENNAIGNNITLEMQEEIMVGNQSVLSEQVIDEGILFDVTGFNAKDYFNRSVHTSSQVYITLKYDGYKCEGIRLFEGTALSLLVSQENFQFVSELETHPIPDKTVSNLVQNNGSLIDSVVISFIPFPDEKCNCIQTNIDLLFCFAWKPTIPEDQKQQQSNYLKVKTGLEYDEKLIDCCSGTNFQTLEYVDLAVLRMKISPSTNLLSYSLFSQNLDALITKHEKFVHSINPGCELYVRLDFQRFSNISDKINDRYKALLSHHIKVWKEENSSTTTTTTKITFILPTYPQNVSIPSNTDFLRTSVGSTINLIACDERPVNWVKDLPPFFRNISVEITIHEPDCDFGEWIATRLLPISSYTQASLTIALVLTGEELGFINELTVHAPLLNIHSIHFGGKTYWWNASLVHHIVEWAQNHSIQIGCYLWEYDDYSQPDAESMISQMNYRCGMIFNVSSELLLDFHKTPDQITSDWLLEIEQAKISFEEMLPGKHLIISIRLPNNELDGLTVFCNKYKQEYNEQYNAITTFANVHGWSNFFLRLLFAGGYAPIYSQDNWWQNIATTEDINRTITDFSFFVHTNEALGNEKHFPNSQSCVVRTEAAPELGIGFLKNGHSGTTVSMDLREQVSLNTKELETLLLFAFGKFPTVELIAKNREDLNIAGSVLTGRLLEVVRKESNMSAESQLVYLELPLHLIYDSTTALNKFPSNVAIHFSGWEKNHTNIIEIFNTNLGKLSNGQYFGITVANCGNELNLNLTRLTDLPIVKFIVCGMDPLEISDSSQEKTDKYLSTMFYIQKLISERSTHFDVIFRLHWKHTDFSKDNRKITVEKFLRFVNDVHQHGATYKIQYFIVNAFSNQVEQKKGLDSWWRIANYDDLHNTSVHTDIEDDHFNRPTKSRFELPSDPPGGPPSTNVITVVIISVLSILLILFTLTFWLYRTHMRKQLLTQQEIHAFYNGVSNDNTSDNYQQEEGTSTWMGMEFPKRFQIPKRRIELGELIGSGEFGQVFIGLLDKETDVAVKVPRQSGCAETFKSALSEVKILLYVGDGSHPNVISFIGAYTKEIHLGKLYILSEYCHKGSLLDYLRDIQAGIRRDDGESSQVDLYQLDRFAFEIASGMEFISGKKVIHGDLATRNILLTSDLTCKISDFGLSRKLYEYTKYVKTSQVPLPWRWLATETLKSMEFTTKSDIWSYGVTVWEIFSLGGEPYPGILWSPGHADNLEKGMRLEKADYASDDIHDKLLECWSLSPESRPSFGELAEYFGDDMGSSSSYEPRIPI